MIDEFIDFLVQHDALRAYLDALDVECTQEAINYIIEEDLDTDELLTCLPAWYSLQGGWHYWDRLDHKWLEKVLYET